MKKNVILAFLCLGLGLWNGCQTYHGTKFAPLQPKLDSLGYGGAQSMSLVNSSGQAMHNVHFRAYMWGQSHLEQSPQQPYMLTSASGLPQRVPALTYSFMGSAGKLDAGQVIHFNNGNTGGESRILEPVTKIQIVGSCDEGDFRETWVLNGRGVLVLVGVPTE
jgi:hypothetical protein